MKHWILLLICLIPIASIGQEHPFLSRFELREGNGWVSIEWTMIAGGTCDGTRIMRSTDSLNFEAVGMISGICGDIVDPVPYNFIDHTAPEMATLYYRLELGVNGYSSIKRIDLQRLTSVEHRFQPSPANERGELLLRIDPEEKVEIQFFDPHGRSVATQQGRGGRHPIDVSSWPAGVYVYQVRGAGAVLTGRFVVE